MIKVGTHYDGISAKGKEVKKHYTYGHVIYEKDGWADPEKFLPEDFDMVWLNIKGKEPITGWINGKTWVGFRLKPLDKVLSWKKEEEKK